MAAPSTLQRPTGDRVKTGRPALARLLRLGETARVAVPSVEEVTARDLVRAREEVRQDLPVPGTGGRRCCRATDSSTAVFDAGYEAVTQNIGRRERLTLPA